MDFGKLDKTIEIIEDKIILDAKSKMLKADVIMALAKLIEARTQAEVVKKGISDIF